MGEITESVPARRAQLYSCGVAFYERTEWRFDYQHQLHPGIDWWPPLGRIHDGETWPDRLDPQCGPRFWPQKRPLQRHLSGSNYNPHLTNAGFGILPTAGQ